MAKGFGGAGGGAGGFGSSNYGRRIGAPPPAPAPAPRPPAPAPVYSSANPLGAGPPPASAYDFSSGHLQSDPSPELADIFSRTSGELGADDPYLTEMIDNWRKQYSNDNTERMTTRANMQVDQQLAGAGQRIAEQEARTGNTGGAASATQAAGETAQRLKAGNVANIQLQREQDRDRLLSVGSSILGAPGRRRLEILQQAGSLAGGLSSDRRRGADQVMQQRQIEAQIAQQQADAMRQWFATLWN